MLFGAAMFAGAALADDAGLMRCRSIANDANRLACYDALAKQVEASRFGLPPNAPTPAPAATAPAASASSAAAPKAEAPRAPATAGAAPPKAVTSAPAPAPAPAPASAADFGLEAKKVPEINRIESTIPGHFEGWGADQVIKLANGQAWQIADKSTGYASKDNPKVAVRRGALGAFYLEIEGMNKSPRVRRVE
jgi:hypothetical protein